MWLGSRVVSVLDSGAVRHGFTSKPRRCRVTVLGRLFTPIVSLFTKRQKLVAALLRVVRVTADLEESNGRNHQVYDSQHLQANCQELVSASGPYAWQSRMGYLCLHVEWHNIDSDTLKMDFRRT